MRWGGHTCKIWSDFGRINEATAKRVVWSAETARALTIANSFKGLPFCSKAVAVTVSIFDELVETISPWIIGILDKPQASFPWGSKYILYSIHPFSLINSITWKIPIAKSMKVKTSPDWNFKPNPFLGILIFLLRNNRCSLPLDYLQEGQSSSIFLQIFTFSRIEFPDVKCVFRNYFSLSSDIKSFEMDTTFFISAPTSFAENAYKYQRRLKSPFPDLILVCQDQQN